MAEGDINGIVITKPGVLAFGTGLPSGSSISSFFEDKTVIQVSCGKDHSAIVCSSGRVYIFGKNQGVDNNITEPTLVDSLNTVWITQADCGEQYTMFLSDTGELYSCGVNDCGQLGLGHNEVTPTPLLVTGLPPVKKVTAGSYHTVVLTENGEVWVCGFNADGQLGLGHTKNRNTFTFVSKLPEAIIDISCGAFYTALVSSSGNLFMAGSNLNGILSLCTAKEFSSFKKVSFSSGGIGVVSCGYLHTVAVGVDGTTWAWGRNVEGQLGTGDTRGRSAPTRMIGLEGHSISQVNTGSNHTALLTKDGDVFVCGRGAIGEFGLDRKVITKVKPLPKSTGLVVQQMAFSSTYSILLVVHTSSIRPAPQLKTASEVQIKEAPKRENISGSEKTILQSLECPVCLKTMCAPIHQCVNGHNLCGVCRSNTNIEACPLCRGDFTSGRNIALENLSAEIPLPCTECLLRMPTCDLEKHINICPLRQYDCPLRKKTCDWRGRPDAMLEHAFMNHPDRTWLELPRMFTHSTSEGQLLTDVLSAHNQVFTLHRSYDEVTKEFKAAVRYIGPPEKTRKYSFEFAFILDNKNSNTYCRNVCSDIESIEDMFKSFNCVSIKNAAVDSFVQCQRLVCRVNILEVETRSRLADQIDSLLIAQEI